MSQSTERMSDRYAALAEKSAANAEAAAQRAELEANADEPRGAKRARREAKEWAEQATLDAMRAHGALSAEINQFETKHDRAEEAVRRANAARDRAVQIYRDLKAGDREE